MRTLIDSKSAARSLRREVWNIGGKVRFPVDPYVMAARLGIKVREGQLDADTAGYILKKNGVVTVMLNQNDAPNRKRFTLAHELGHFVQRRDDPEIGFVDRRDELAFSGRDPHEIWANRFAAELLMPAAVLKKWWATGDSVEEIRRKLNVSQQALAYRLENLGLL